jgi:hypothetical protein
VVLVKGEILLEKSLSELRGKCAYIIETESVSGKISRRAENDSQLWNILDEIKKDGQRIIRIQSGIAEQLEQFYKEDEK